jgi:hypothetical protein
LSLPFPFFWADNAYDPKNRSVKKIENKDQPLKWP